MNNQLSLGKYRLFDLLVFTGLMVFFEYVLVKVFPFLSGIYSISLFLTIALIVLIRWGLWAAIPIIAGGITYCLANDGKLNHYLIYTIGNLFILLNALWFLMGKNKIREGYITVSYVISGFILTELGRAIVAAILENNFLSAFISFLGVDSLSAAIALVIILIMRKQNGLFEDQISYLKRVQAEEK